MGAQKKEKDTNKILRSEQGFLIRQLETKFNFQNFLDVTKADKTLNHAFVNKIVTKMPQNDKNGILKVVVGGFR